MLEPLLLDLLEWVATETRSYAEVMEAWRTSCPRLPVREEAIDRCFVQRTTIDGRSGNIVLTEAGRASCATSGCWAASPPPDGANPASAAWESSRNRFTFRSVPNSERPNGYPRRFGRHRPPALRTLPSYDRHMPSA